MEPRSSCGSLPIERVGSTSTPQRDRSEATLENTASEGIGRRQFDGPAQSQPTGTILAPLIRPDTTLDRHHLSIHTPLSQGSSEQMEVTGGAEPTVLGMKSVKRRCFRWTARTNHARDSQRARGVQAKEGNIRRLQRSRVEAWSRGARGESNAWEGHECGSSNGRRMGEHTSRAHGPPGGKNPATPKPY